MPVVGVREQVAVMLARHPSYVYRQVRGDLGMTSPFPC